MSFRFTTSLVLATAALVSAVGVARADSRLECPPNPIASSMDGGSLDAAEIARALQAVQAIQAAQLASAASADPTDPGNPAGPFGLAGSWCRDANDPQCAPLSPTPNAPSWAPGASLPRWVNASFQLATPALGRDDRAGSLLAPTADFRLPHGQGSAGYARSLERPPRTH